MERLVIEAINCYSKESGEEFRFFPFKQLLESDTLSVDAKTTIMALINTLIDSIIDLESRFSMRMEFMQMSFQDILVVFLPS